MLTRNPATGIYPATPDYVHAVEVRSPQRLLYLSGTMGLDPDGVAGRTLDEQLTLVWSNVRTILSSAGMSVANIVRITSYLRDVSYAEANQNAGSPHSAVAWCRPRPWWSRHSRPTGWSSWRSSPPIDRCRR